MADQESTTKRCKCGCTALVTLPSQNLKICGDCGERIPWDKTKDQKPYWG